MDNIYDNIYNNINNLYTKIGFLEKYGKDVFMTIIIMLIFLIIFSYFYIINQIEPIKANWVKERCHPLVIPFAGFINAPHNVNKMSYTAENFNGCVNNILEITAQYALAPFYYIINVFTKSLIQLANSIQNSRKMFDKIRTNVGSVSNDVYGRTLNITVPIIELLINVKDTIGKTQGVLAAGIFSLFGGYLSLKSLLGAIIQIMMNIVYMLIALIVILWIIPFTWGAAAAMSLVALGVAIPLTAISVKSRDIFKLSVKGVPKIPRCFDEDTEIRLIDGNIKKIKNIIIGDILVDGSKITGFMKSSTEDHTFYNLNGIVVTGTHRVHYPNKGWILVREHPESKLILKYNKSFMYCVGTDSKLFTINETIFGDWDELDNNDVVELYKNASHIVPSYFMRKHIHQYLDGGFIGETTIELNNGIKKHIKDVNVNDVLKCGEKVLTIVKLDAKDLNGVYEYSLCDKIFIGGPNLEIVDKYLGNIDTTRINGVKIKSPNYIYNLVTDTGTFYVNDIRFCDYNSTTDKYLKNRKRIFDINEIPDMNIYEY